MNWYWGRDVHAVLHGEDLVILDRRRNDYLILPRAAQSVTLSKDRAAALVDTPVLEMLTGAGLGACEPTDRRRAATLPPSPRRDLGDARCTPSRGDTLRLARATLGLIGGYWLRPFRDLGEPGPERGRPRVDETALRRLVLTWRGLLPWVPFQGACLYRAASLRAYLGQEASGVSWVFGVSTWPFAAHCWLQRDDLVLNDTLARVSRYTPILSL